MGVLVIDCFPADDVDSEVVKNAIDTLRFNGHEVTHQQLVGGPFETFMTAAERLAYHSETPLITREAVTSAAALKSSASVLFCYPTTLFTLPPVLKSYLERVFVPGVSFVLDAKNRVRPGLTHVRRLGVITTTPHDAAATRRARDAGRRSILWGPRLVCHPLARRTFVSIPTGTPDPAAIERALRRW